MVRLFTSSITTPCIIISSLKATVDDFSNEQKQPCRTTLKKCKINHRVSKVSYKGQSSRNGRGSEEYCRTNRNSHVEELEKESEASRLGIVVYRFYRGYKRSTFCSKYCYLQIRYLIVPTRLRLDGGKKWVLTLTPTNFLWNMGTNTEMYVATTCRVGHHLLLHVPKIALAY